MRLSHAHCTRGCDNSPSNCNALFLQGHKVVDVYSLHLERGLPHTESINKYIYYNSSFPYNKYTVHSHTNVHYQAIAVKLATIQNCTLNERTTAFRLQHSMFSHILKEKRLSEICSIKFSRNLMQPCIERVETKRISTQSKSNKDFICIFTNAGFFRGLWLMASKIRNTTFVHKVSKLN
jgi:hypothetical protein